MKAKCSSARFILPVILTGVVLLVVIFPITAWAVDCPEHEGQPQTQQKVHRPTVPVGDTIPTTWWVAGACILLSLVSALYRWSHKRSPIPSSLFSPLENTKPSVSHRPLASWANMKPSPLLVAHQKHRRRVRRTMNRFNHQCKGGSVRNVQRNFHKCPC